MDKSSKKTSRSSTSRKDPKRDPPAEVPTSSNRRDNPLGHKLSIVANTNPTLYVHSISTILFINRLI